jgi:hypothetical protein
MSLIFLECTATKRNAWEDRPIKEFGMWSYTEAENTWLAPSREAARPPGREDAPDFAA